MVLAMAGADTGGAGHPWAAGRGQMLRLLEQQSVVMVSPRPEAARAIGWTPAGLVAPGPPLLGKGRMLVRMPPDSLPRHSTQSGSWGGGPCGDRGADVRVSVTTFIDVDFFKVGGVRGGTPKTDALDDAKDGLSVVRVALPTSAPPSHAAW